MEVADDSGFVECGVSGFVWILAYGVECAVVVVLYYDGDMVHAVAVPECYVTVCGGVVACFSGESVL